VGDALFAFKAIAAVFAVILAVLAAIFAVFVVILDVLFVTLVSNAAIAFVLDVILAVFVAMELVFAVILEVLDVTLVSNAAILVVFEVMLEVLEVILVSAVVTLVGKLAMVDELTPPTVFTVGKSAVPPKSFVNLIFPFTLAVASGVAEAAIPEATPAVKAACTNSVVAICVVFVPSAAVGAIGVPVNVGDALFAFKAIAAVFAEILAVFAAIFAVFVVIFVLFVAMSAVFDVILAVFDNTLESKSIMLFLFAVILAVLAAIFVVFVKIFALFVAISAIFAVILAVLDAIFEVLVVTVAGSVEIVDELTPPMLFTVGKSAVPPKSFVNLILPFTLAVASGVADPPTIDETNSVVAI
jgi:hypothetical protein